jgi:hypothetical protein
VEKGSKATYSHVGLATDVGLCQRLFQLTRDSEITQLDLSFPVDEDVCRLDIWIQRAKEATGQHRFAKPLLLQIWRKEDGKRTSVHDLQRILQESQPSNHTSRYPRQHVLILDPSLVDIVERASIHVLHAVVDTRLDEERSVKLDDLGGDGSMKDVELHKDSVQFGLVELEVDLLQEKNQMDEQEGRAR